MNSMKVRQRQLETEYLSNIDIHTYNVHDLDIAADQPVTQLEAVPVIEESAGSARDPDIVADQTYTHLEAVPVMQESNAGSVHEMDIPADQPDTQLEAVDYCPPYNQEAEYEAENTACITDYPPVTSEDAILTESLDNSGKYVCLNMMFIIITYFCIETV